jgi:hypothetical protein
MRIKKYKNDYYSHQFNLNQLRHTVRNNLVTLSLFMTRLRAFSRQLQPSLMGIFNTTTSAATTAGTTAAAAAAVNEVVGHNQLKEIVNFANQKRLSSFVYAIHVRII